MPFQKTPVRIVVALAALAFGTNAGISVASAHTLSKTETHKVATHHEKQTMKKAHAARAAHARAAREKAARQHAAREKAARERAAAAKAAAGKKRTSAPVASTPVASTPVTSTPVTTTPVTTTPVTTAPVTTAPVTTTPVTTTAPVTTTPVTTNPTSVPQPVGQSGNWTMAFDDEFNGTSLNTSVWDTHNGWTNQNNVTDYTSNITVGGGYATLKLASSTSGAAMATDEDPAATLAVGEYAEARINFAGSGDAIFNWPAFWVSGPGWPNGGENDIAEGLGTLTVNYHSPSGAHNFGTVAGDWSNGFHTYGIYRGGNYCSVYWDGKLVDTYPTDDDGAPESLIFTMGASNDLALGASGQMQIDYVRIWAPASAS